jgi:hypothetical protein
MVASALNRPQMTQPATDGDAPEAGMRERVIRQLQPIAVRLKNRWVILALFLLAYVPFGLNYMSAYQARTELQTQIDEQKALLAVPERATDDIEISLASWMAALEAASADQLSPKADSSFVERLLATANSAGVTIVSTSRSDNTKVTVGTDVYDATPVLLQVIGPIQGLQDFITAIEGDAIEALEVQNSLIASQEGVFGASIRAIVFNRLATAEELAAMKVNATPVPTGRVTNEELDRAAGGSK